MTDLRQAAMATTFVYRARVVLVTITCCAIALVGAVMAFSWLFAAPPKAPESCGASGVYRVVVDPKLDGSPYLTVVCRNGRSWFKDPNL